MEVVTEELFLNNTAFGIVFSQLQNNDPSLYRQKKPAGQGSPHHSLTITFEGILSLSQNSTMFKIII
jgi:hypothetical protein